MQRGWGERYDLPEMKDCNKVEWKTVVTKNVKEKYNYKKLEYEKMKEETCGVKDYLKSLNLPDARPKFALRSKMT